MTDLSGTSQTAPSATRKTPRYPGELKRRRRQSTITFSDEKIPDQLRDLAWGWGLTTNHGQRPSPSAALDWLLSPRLKAALRGEVSPPPPGWDLGDPVPQGIVDDSSTANEIGFADRFCTLIRRRPGVDGKPLSNREIARRTGLSASHIGKLKGGTSEPGYRALTSIANCFNVDVSFFFDRHTPTSEALLIYARDQIILEVAARVARMDLKKRQAILRLARVLSEDVIEVTDSEHDDELA